MVDFFRRNKTDRIIIATLLALTLVATAPLTGLAGSGFVLARDTQQNRIIQHAMSHQGQRFKQIKDRNSGLIISAGTPWCAWFIEHCAYKTGLSSLIPAKSKSDLVVGNLAKDLVNNKKATITFVNKTLWNKRKGSFNKNRRSYNRNYQPKKGDIVLYANYQLSGSYWFSHVGFIYENCEKALKGVKTIEGNTLPTNRRKWEQTSIVGVRGNANDSNKERRIAAYITPNYCKHKNVDETTGVCMNSKCKADYCYFDQVDTSCATDEEAGVTYKIIVDPENTESGWVRCYPSLSGNMMIAFTETSAINVLGTVKDGTWYKVSYITATGTVKYGYVAADRIQQDDNNISPDNQ